MNILITVCARGGSKGIPKKNIKIVGGRPLIDHSIRMAKKFAAKWGGVIELSTDSEEIKGVAASLGLSTEYTRPAKLATDKAGKIDVLAHLWKYAEKTYQQKFDYVLDLDVSSPLRTLEDVEAAFAQIRKDKKALNIFSVSHAHRNPYFNMVEPNGKGYFGLVKKGKFKTRQESPAVYDINGSFYIYTRAFFEQECPSAITKRSLVYPMKHLCFDLDEMEDYQRMNWLLENKLLDFKFDY